MLSTIAPLAVEAGRRIEAVRAQGMGAAGEKSDRSPVTRADREADALLRRGLLELERIGWLSEETADDGARLERRRLWVVDPLDGTKEFIAGIPEYTVAIALVEDGAPVLGCVHNPATGDVFTAVRGGGAFRNGEPIRVAEGRALLASRSETRRGEFEPFEADWEVRPVGSIQYKLALIAAGVGAVTLSRGPKHEWDVCAGALLITEAGGHATDLFGGELRFNQPFPKTRGILGGAPEAYARALREIEAIGASDRMEELENSR